MAIIPSLAIHLDRGMNNSFAPNRATDLCPLVSAGVLAVGRYRTPGGPGCRLSSLGRFSHATSSWRTDNGTCVWGAAREFVSSPRLDDLMCAFTSFKAFLAAENPSAVTGVLLLRQRRGGLQHQAGRHVHAACRRAAAPHGIAWPHTRALPPRGGKVHACELRQRPCGAS